MSNKEAIAALAQRLNYLRKDEYAALENLKVGEQLTVKYNAREDLMRFIDIIKEKWDVEMKFDYYKGWNVRRVA